MLQGCGSSIPVSPEGFFKNTNDLFGPGRIQYVEVVKTDEDLYVARKLLGDAHIPRGQICFRTVEKADDLAQGVASQLQSRGDIEDDEG